MSRGDHLEHRRHADQVGAPRARGANLGGCLVVRAVQTEVHAFVHRRSIAGDGTQPLAVRVGQVDEPPGERRRRIVAGERRVTGEVDVVADHHRLADGPVFAQHARAVGEHRDAATERGRGAHAVHHWCHAVSFVEMRAPGEDEHARRADCDRQRLAAVAERRRLLESGNISERATLCLTEHADGIGPTRAEHCNDVVRAAESRAQVVGCARGEIERCAHCVQSSIGSSSPLASNPAAASRASSSSRGLSPGARALSLATRQPWRDE